MPKTQIKIKLVGTDGNCFAILAKVIRALKKAGYEDLARQYEQEATAGDYDHLLRVTMEYVDVE